MEAAPILLLLFVTCLCAGLFLAGLSIWASILLAVSAALAILLLCNEMAMSR
jgi:hypothetical protein